MKSVLDRLKNLESVAVETLPLESRGKIIDDGGVKFTITPREQVVLEGGSGSIKVIEYVITQGKRVIRKPVLTIEEIARWVVCLKLAT